MTMTRLQLLVGSAGFAALAMLTADVPDYSAAYFIVLSAAFGLVGGHTYFDA